MQFLDIITSEILQVVITCGDWPLLEYAYFNKYLITLKAGSRCSLLDLIESLIVKNLIEEIWGNQ